MYTRHFGLTAAPFRITPDTRRFFGGGQRAEVLDTLVYAITSGEGMVKVTGEVGTGKTMLCRMLQEYLPDSVEVVYIANPNLTGEEILQLITHDLGLPGSAGDTRLQRQQRLQEHLLEAHRQGRQVVVFLEEAQRMPVETLEEIRLLSNLETRSAKLLQLVLFGQPELDQLLEKHEIRQLRDRISHSFELTPLNTAEVRDYLRFRLHSAGYRGGELFTAPASRQLALSSQGLIRRIHVLADKAMLAAFADGERQVRWKHVWRARSDRLPARRWSGGPRELAAGLFAGALLAVTGSQLLPPIDTPALQQAMTSPSPKRQNIDELRAAAIGIQPAAGLPLVSRRLRASHQWLQRPADGGLTIQLLLTREDDLQTVEKLLEKQPYRQLLNDIYLYRSEVKGRPRWSLLYGEFDERAKALAALAELPEEIQRHQPYLRSLAALRKAQRLAARGHGNKDEQG
ncbi:MAG TPA: AAA family ATPase [Gammaproteobacteria bacterium]|nr:AAA family ATPase [Gammaproteobacteria bacterium]